MPEKYVVRVANQESRTVSADGRVIVDVPRLERGCVTYLFGVVKVREESPYNVRAIGVYRGNQVVRKLSLNDIGKLPSDSEGYRIVKVE